LKYSKNVWNQLKNITAAQLITALEKDGFILDVEVRAERVYRHPSGRKVTIHYHKGSKTYEAGLLKSLFENIGWAEKDMLRLKLIKK